MTAVENVAAEVYEMLLQLRYPGIAQVNPEDAKDSVLGGENRLFLLTWLLKQYPAVPPDEFSGTSDEEKLVKWYTNVGICIAPDALLGKVEMQEQVPTLNNLLMFMKNALVVEQPEPKRISSVLEILKSRIGKVTNIIPPTCKLSSKMNYDEALQYLKTPKEESIETENSTVTITVEEPTSESTKEVFFYPPGFMQLPSAITKEVSDSTTNDSRSDREFDTKAAVEKFTEAFESVATWANPNDQRSAPSLKSMDTVIENIHSNMAILKETIRAKEELSRTDIPNGVERHAMPLDEIVEDMVITIEKISNLNDNE